MAVFVNWGIKEGGLEFIEVPSVAQADGMIIYSLHESDINKL